MTIQVTRDGGSSANDIFLEKSDWEGGGLAVYCSCWVAGWGLGEHEHLIIALFLPIVLCRNWKVPWTIRGIDWGHGAVRDFELECKL